MNIPNQQKLKELKNELVKRRRKTTPSPPATFRFLGTTRPKSDQKQIQQDLNEMTGPERRNLLSQDLDSWVIDTLSEITDEVKSIDKRRKEFRKRKADATSFLREWREFIIPDLNTNEDDPSGEDLIFIKTDYLDELRRKKEALNFLNEGE